MAKAPVIEDAQMRHAFKVAAITGQTPARDAALLHVLYGTGMTATELAQLEVADVIDEQGRFKRKSEVRPAISFNGRPRPVFWVNARVCEALTQVIRKLHDQAGIEAAGATAARCTCGVRLHRKGYDLRHIREVLGLATLSAAKALCDGDPVDLGRIVAKVI